MSRLVVDGHLEEVAVEIANQEILSVYRSLNEDPEIMGDALGAIYFGLFDKGAESIGPESGRPVC